MPMSFDTCRNMNVEVSWYAMTGEWYTFDTIASQWKRSKKPKTGLEYESNLTLSHYEEMDQLLDSSSETC